MAGRVTFTYIDNSAEKTSVGFYIPDLDAANVDGWVDNTLGGNLGDMRLATDTLTLCNEVQQTVTAVTYKSDGVPPADTDAQRERAVEFTINDTVLNRKSKVTIGGFNMSGAQTGTDAIDLSNPLIAAWVFAYESNAVSEFGNPVEVISAKHIGRSS